MLPKGAGRAPCLARCLARGDPGGPGPGCAGEEPLCWPTMEKTPKDDPKPEERRGAPEEGESYEDSWYQVLKRRRTEDPPADEKQTEE